MMEEAGGGGLRAEILEAEARRLSLVRLQMVEAHPFWGYLLLQMRFMPAEVPVFAATD